MELRQWGHSRVGESTSGSVFCLSIILLTGRTITKKTAAATTRKLMMVSMTAP
jgi:hypothetical protein